MPRGGFVRFHVDRHGNAKEKDRSKDALRVKTSKIPILAYEDSNGVSPGHSPTRWKVMKGIDDNFQDKPASTFTLPKTPDYPDEHQGRISSSSKNMKIEPIPISRVDKVWGKKGGGDVNSVEGMQSTVESSSQQHQQSNISMSSSAALNTANTDEGWTSFTVRGPNRSIFKEAIPSDSFSIDDRTAGSSADSDYRAVEKMRSLNNQIVTSCSLSEADEESLPVDELLTDNINSEFNRKDRGMLYTCPLVEEKRVEATAHSGKTEAATFLSVYADDGCCSSQDSSQRTNNEDEPISTQDNQNMGTTRSKECSKENAPLQVGHYSQKKISESHAERKKEKNRKSMVREKEQKRSKNGKSIERSVNLNTTGNEKKLSKPDYAHDDAGVWNEFFSPPSGDDANGWVTPKELLSPALFAKTPTAALEQTMQQPAEKKAAALFDSSASVADILAAAESAIDACTKDCDSNKRKESKDEVLRKFLEMAMPVIQSASITDDQQKDLQKVAGKLGMSLDDNYRYSRSKVGLSLAKSQQDGVPLDEVKIPKRKSFKEAKKIIAEKRSIHLRNPPKLRRVRSNRSPSSHSLLDDSIGEEASVSAGSEAISALSFPTPKPTKDQKSKRSKPKTIEEIDEPTNDWSNVDSTEHHRPLGSSAQEIRMLNQFLKIAGPSLKRSSKMSAEDSELLHDKALKAGLPEDFVNRMLDRSAGIQRWEEASTHLVRSYSNRKSKHNKDCAANKVSPLGSDCGKSFHTRSTVESVTYHSRYTRDTESISYYTCEEDGFTRRTSPKTEVFVGDEKYGCLDRIGHYFWLESDMVGNDMIQNVAAVISQDSGSMDADDKPRSSNRMRRGRGRSRRWRK